MPIDVAEMCKTNLAQKNRMFVGNECCCARGNQHTHRYGHEAMARLDTMVTIAQTRLLSYEMGKYWFGVVQCCFHFCTVCTPQHIVDDNFEMRWRIFAVCWCRQNSQGNMYKRVPCAYPHAHNPINVILFYSHR